MTSAGIRPWPPRVLPRPVRVLVIDDSASMCQLLSRALSSDPGIAVVGAAGDAYEARDLIVKLDPDVITLDIAMPRMDGVSFLRLLMRHHPMPVIIISGLVHEGAGVVMDALSAGAVDVLSKPSNAAGIVEFTAELIDRVKSVVRPASLGEGGEAERFGRPPRGACRAAPGQLIFALGASTGGVHALTEVLGAFPPGSPATVVAQHIPASFTASFARRLDAQCQIVVKEAVHGDRAIAGQALIAPGGAHMTLNRDSQGYFVEVHEGLPIRHQRPSVDLLFGSVARAAGAGAVGAILTGMGADGALGLKQMRDAGAHTIAQDQATSAVFGMPRAAITMDAVVEVVPLQDIAAAMFEVCQCPPQIPKA